MSRLALVLMLITVSGCSGASKIFNRFSEPDGYWLPLTVDLRLDPSVTDAALDYTDACGRHQTLTIGERLTASLKRDMGLVFQRVQIQPTQKADGAIDVALGLKEVDLFIPRQTTKTYPATVVVGATVAYTDADGNVLYTKNLRTEAHGSIETEGQSCEVKGLGAVANEAVSILTQGLKKHLGTSTKIREAAHNTKSGSQSTTSSAGAPVTPSAPVPAATPGIAPPAEAAAQSASLAYRVMLREGQTNERLESGEKVTMEVEVSNTGLTPAKEVMVRLSGTPVLVEQFANPVPVGDLQPNEMKRVVVSARMPATAAATQGELVLSIEAANGSSPVQKKFPIEWHPAHLRSGAPVDDVDHIPDNLPALERKKAVGIAIGLQAFRDSNLPPVQFAAHDAEVMAEYFKTFAGIPSDQVQLLTDDHALKDDVIEVFEEWLPDHAQSGSDVIIFIAGRAVVNPSTGAVSLVPHEADLAAGLRLVSLRRLHEALARLPIQRAVLMMDLTLTPSPGDPSADGKDPAWAAISPNLRGDKLVQIVGMTGHEPTHQYEEGRHGLFTYFLLKGLGGAADEDRNGIVALGELCGYVRGQVAATAKEKYQEAQHPMCVPSMTSRAKSAGVPLSRLK